MCDYCNDVNSLPDYDRLKVKVQNLIDELDSPRRNGINSTPKVYVWSLVNAWNEILACEDYLAEEVREVRLAQRENAKAEA